MAIYTTSPGQRLYGFDLGILIIDADQPYIPGDVGNAATWDFPVLYHEIPGCTIERLIYQGDQQLANSVIDSARYLERQGVKTITSNCGFLLRFQECVREQVNVPVFLSSLLELPQILAGPAQRGDIGIVAASGHSLTPDLLCLSGVDVPDTDRMHVFGMDRYPAFNAPFMQNSGYLDTDEMEAACRDMAARMMAERPDMQAIVLECAVLPPYAGIFGELTGLPVYDFTTIIHRNMKHCGILPAECLYTAKRQPA